MQIELKQEFFKSILKKNVEKLNSYNNIDNEFVLRKEVINYSLELIQKIFSRDKDTGIILSASEKTTLNKFKDGALKDVSAFGLHLFDEITGRYSYMNKFGNYENNDVTENPRFNELYSKLWLRIYTELLKPNSSLINFFYDNEDIWEDKDEHLHLMWDYHSKNDLKNLEKHEICLNFYKRFVSENSKIAEEISNLIQVTLEEGLELNLSLNDTDIVNLLFLKILPELNDNSIRERLYEIVIVTRLELLNSSIIRKDFFKKIKLLSFKRGEENRDDNLDDNEKELWSNMSEAENIWNKNKNNIRHTWTWSKVKEMLEAFQSTILNQFSFCGDNGFRLYKLPSINPKYDNVRSSIHGNLILISDQIDSDKIIRKSIENYLEELQLYLDRNSKKPRRISRIEKTQESDLLTKISEGLFKRLRSSVIYRKPNSSIKRNVLLRWSNILHKISNESIHERKNIEFLVGIGTKSFHEIHFKKYVEPFDYLKSSNTDIIKIVHFIKSYFSLFEVQNNRIIWFDELGHFLGIFEFNSLSQILASANKNPVFLANIKGKNSFDILHKTKSPIIRVKNGKYIDLKVFSELFTPISNVTEKIFLNNKCSKQLVDNFSSLITRIVNETIIIGSGTSFIILNDLDSNNLKENVSNWKVKFEFQSKNLSERLTKYESPVLALEDLLEFGEGTNQDLVDKIIKEILLLTKLDGSILVKLNEKGVFINPSQFTVPLIAVGETKEEEPKEFQMEHFDYFELRNKGKIFQNDSLDRIVAVNDKFYENSATTVEELQMFIADIDYEEIFTNVKNARLKELTFLNSSGTRHHSLYGLSLSAKEPLYVVVLSDDGQIRVFWNGLVFYSDS